MLVYYRRLVIEDGRGSIDAQVAEDSYALVPPPSNGSTNAGGDARGAPKINKMDADLFI
jgi:hypothetical protein